MWTLALLLPLVAAADDTATWIQVPGLGEVSLTDAAQSCRAAAPRGEVATLAPSQRAPAFQEVATHLLSLTPMARQAYFTYYHPAGFSWPSAPHDVTYVPRQLPMAPAGVAGACLAAAKVYIARADAVTTACRRGINDCQEALPEVPRAKLRRALSRAKREARSPAILDTDSDPILDQLYQLDWPWLRNPAPLLATACRWPEAQARASLFIDGHDLSAARLACMQRLALLGLKPLFLDFPCDTEWDEISPAEWAQTVPADSSDVGVGVAMYRDAGPAYNDDRRWSREIGANAIVATLFRMDPSAGECHDPQWATVWKGDLVNSWQVAQQGQACADQDLPLRTRAAHCAGIVDRLAQACDQGDVLACTQLATAYTEGIRTQPNPLRAALAWRDACALGAGCEALALAKDELRRTFESQLAAKNLSAARYALQDWASLLGPDWVRANTPRVEALRRAGEAP